jgi:branched-chain amino acid transport system permease protein
MFRSVLQLLCVFVFGSELLHASPENALARESILAVFDIPLQLWALQIFTGLALGSVLVLLAVGLSLIFGMLAVVNFAHGAFYTVGAYAGVFVFGLTGNFWLGLVAVPLIAGTIGLAVERVLLRPLYGRGIDYPLLLTFGLSYVVVDAIKMIFGKVGLPLSAPAVLQGAVNIGIGYFPLYRLFLIGAMALIVAGLWLFLEKTSYGLIIRAGARDSEIVRVLGIDVSRVWMVVFGIGTGAAGIAGYLSAPMESVIPEMGIPVLVQAFVVTVVGGMGSLAGAVIAGLLVGVVTSITVMIAPQLADAAMFGLMAVVLLLRPQGLFGRRGLME